MYEKIKTTEPRAKEARVIAEKLITTAKQNTLHARRQARKILPRPHAPKGMLSAKGSAQKQMREELMGQDPVKRLFDVIVPKLADRQSGYTRLTKIGFRRGDAASMVVLELVVD
jgi:large subunit ribosomal protein L17